MSIRDHSLEHNNRGHKCDFTLDYFKREHNCKTLLDIGAGKGLNCAWATKHHGYKATGIEIDTTWLCLSMLECFTNVALAFEMLNLS